MIGFHVILYGLLAAVSAITITSVVVVLRTPRRRINGLCFAAGFVVAQLLVALLALTLGTGSVPQRHAHRSLEAVLELLTGLALLATAARLKRPPKHPTPPRERPLVAKRDAALSRLSSLRPAEMLGAGGLLGIGGPKRITLALLAAATIAAGGFSTTTKYSFAFVYVAVATILVWSPVMLTIAFGSRAGEWSATAHAWWRTRRSIVTFTVLTVFGVYLVVAGIVGLATS